MAANQKCQTTLRSCCSNTGASCIRTHSIVCAVLGCTLVTLIQVKFSCHLSHVWIPCIQVWKSGVKQDWSTNHKVNILSAWLCDTTCGKSSPPCIEETNFVSLWEQSTKWELKSSYPLISKYSKIGNIARHWLLWLYYHSSWFHTMATELLLVSPCMSQKFSIKKIYSFYLSYAPAFLLEVLIQVVQVASSRWCLVVAA